MIVKGTGIGVLVVAFAFMISMFVGVNAALGSLENAKDVILQMMWVLILIMALFLAIGIGGSAVFLLLLKKKYLNLIRYESPRARHKSGVQQLSIGGP